MNELETKQIFDIIFMMISSLVMIFIFIFTSYKVLVITWKKHKKSKMVKKMQAYINNGQFQKVITFNHEGLPVLVEIIEKKEKKIISL